LEAVPALAKVYPDIKKEVLNDVSFYLDSILKREQKQAVMNVADV